MLRRFLPLLAAILVLMGTSARAQDVMPAPKRAPRTPVTSAPLMQVPQNLDGPAVALDGESLWVGEHEVRLFAITAPPPYAPYGAQAMAALDEILAGKTFKCRVRDRARDGRLVAQCQGTGDIDPALEMIRKGLAVVSRSSVRSSDLGDTYSAAEQAARKSKLGLWEHDGAVAPVPGEAMGAAARDDKPDRGKEPSALLNSDDGLGPEVASPWSLWLERYQVLLAAAIFLLGAMMVPFSLWLRRGWQEKAERRVLAAALRAELGAVRQACRQRAHVLMGGQAEAVPGSLWPKLRSMVFDACIARLGTMGTDMMRRLMTVYGQMADFNALRQQEQQTGVRGEPMAIARGLTVLSDRIAVVMHELEAIEAAKGQNAKPRTVGYTRRALLPAAAAAPLPLENADVTPAMPARNGTGVSEKTVVPTRRLSAAAVMAEATIVQDVIPEPEPEPAAAPLSRHGMFHPAVVAEMLETAIPVPALVGEDPLSNKVAEEVTPRSEEAQGGNIAPLSASHPENITAASPMTNISGSSAASQSEAPSAAKQSSDAPLVAASVPASKPQSAYVPEPGPAATAESLRRPAPAPQDTMARRAIASEAGAKAAASQSNGASAKSEAPGPQGTKASPEGLSDEAFQELLRSATAIRKDLKQAS